MKTTLVDPRQLMRFDFGDAHPFKVYRLGLFFDLCERYGLIERPDVEIRPEVPEGLCVLHADAPHPG